MLDLAVPYINSQSDQQLVVNSAITRSQYAEFHRLGSILTFSNCHFLYIISTSTDIVSFFIEILHFTLISFVNKSSLIINMSFYII